MARMYSDRKPTAIAVGVLFIVATVFSILSGVVNASVLAAPDIARAAAENAGVMAVSALLMMVACGAIVAIPIVMFPLFRRFSEAGAVTYVVVRSFEAGFFLLGAMFIYGLIGIGQAQLANPGADLANAAMLTALVIALQDASFTLGPMIVFSIGALVFSVLLYRTMLVPRWLSIWGLIGGALLLVQGLLIMFDLSTDMSAATLFLPIAVNEMVLAVWLIVKGFEQDAVTHLIG